MLVLLMALEALEFIVPPEVRLEILSPSNRFKPTPAPAPTPTAPSFSRSRSLSLSLFFEQDAASNSNGVVVVDGPGVVGELTPTVTLDGAAVAKRIISSYDLRSRTETT